MPVQALDGVAVTTLGDTLLVVYQAPARLHRSRWAYDRTDELAAAHPKGIIGLMVVLPTAETPDGPTRIENRNRLRKLRGSLRRLVTVPIGDDFRVSIVRAIMRTMAWMQGESSVMVVTSTLDDGLDRLMETRSDASPSRKEIQAALRELYTTLGLPAPTFAARAMAGPSASPP